MPTVTAAVPVAAIGVASPAATSMPPAPRYTLTESSPPSAPAVATSTVKNSVLRESCGEGRTASTEAEREAAYAALNARLMEIAPTIYGFDRQSVFAASNRVKVPALSDPSKAFGLDGMGFTFRLMEMTE